MKKKIFLTFFTTSLFLFPQVFAEDCGCSYSEGGSKISVSYDCDSDASSKSAKRVEKDITTGKEISSTTIFVSEAKKLCS
ncbi:MAG: hypothetical protein EAZ85_00890 [Bacteroidetes bacterium]|nr:MAG: hypothetical protein EAZ85_00890 [Bacteroidota bacterium]TAG86839.1 MAG: hypothetical protein EAZ20_11930 [Bacteroidota bacterium]